MSTEVDRLVVVFDANFAALDAKLNKVIAKNQAAAKKIEDSWSGKGFGAAAKSGFDNLAEGAGEAARAIPGVGAALSKLGPAGLAAAAGIGALAEALHAAGEAVEYADALSKAAQAAHVTTDELQAMQYALRLAGGQGDQAAAGLEAFSTKLGEAQAGLAKAQRGFLELGFSKAQIKGWTDAGDALLAVTAQIEKLKSPAQKDAVVAQLGLDQMKPLVEGGVDQMKAFLDEARKAGVIMDAGLVKQGAALNEQLETAHQKISVQLKSAFIELGPILVILTDKLADMAAFAAKIAAHFASIEHQPTEQLEQLRQQFNAKAAGPLAAVFGTTDKDRAAAAQALGQMIKNALGTPDKPKLPSGGASLADQSKGATDDTGKRTEEAAAALAGALRDRLQAELALTGSVEDRAAIETQIAQQELAQSLARLEKQRAEINADAGLSAATKRTLTAEIGKAEDAEKSAALAKQELIQRTALRAPLDQTFADNQKIDGYFSTMADIAADEATTAKERLAISLKNLDAQQRLERVIQKELLDRDVADKVRPQSSADQILTSADEARAAQRRHLIYQSADPVTQYLRTVQDTTTLVMQDGVKAFDSLADGIADAIVNAKSLGDVMSNVFRQLASDLISGFIKQNLAAPLLQLIPHFAAGTTSSPAGLSLVGERGPELVRLPGNSAVIPNASLHNVRLGGAGGGDVIVNFNNQGAMIWEEAARQMMGYAQDMAARAGAAGMQGARRTMPADLSRASARRLG